MAKSGNGRKLHTGRGHRKLMRILACLLAAVVCMASFCAFLPQSLNAEGAEESVGSYGSSPEETGNSYESDREESGKADTGAEWEVLPAGEDQNDQEGTVTDGPGDNSSASTYENSVLRDNTQTAASDENGSSEEDGYPASGDGEDLSDQENDETGFSDTDGTGTLDRTESVQMEDGSVIEISWGADSGLDQVTQIETGILDQQSDAYASYVQKAEDFIAEEEEEKTIADVRLIGIRLLDAKGNEVQPVKPVIVKVKLADSLPCGEENDLYLLHYKSESNLDDIEKVDEEHTVQEENVEEITFEARSFSVYGIVTTQDGTKEKITRRIYKFLNDDGTDYNFNIRLNNGTTQTTTTNTQIIRNGETLQDVGIPEPLLDTDKGKGFKGWQVVALSGDDITDLYLNDIITLPQTVNTIQQDNTDETVTLKACFTTVNITFHNADGSILRVTQAEPGTYLNLSSYYADTNVTQDGRTLTFFGWSTSSASGAEVLQNLYTVPEQNINLYPVYRYGYWLNFNQNDEDGDPSEASYTESVFVGNAQVQSGNQPTNPTRDGYTFGGWYYDSGCTQAFSFNETTLAGNTTVYAKWNPAAASYNVVFWLEDPDDDDYAYAGEVRKSGTSRNTTAYTVSEADLPETISSIRSYLELNTDTHLIEQQPIYGDGSTIVNVYYDRKEYTLRFYYAYAATTSSWYGSTTTWHVHTETSSYSNTSGTDAQALSEQAGTREISTGRLPTPSGYNNMGSTEVSKSGTTYRYYYFDISAKYGENIESIWPADPFSDTFTSNRNTYSFISWATRNGSEYYSSHSNKNIKGIYSVLDSSLIMDPGETIAQSFLAYWNTPTMYNYQIYYSLLNGEASDIIYNGNGYKLQSTYEVGSTAVWNEQNALSFEGVRAVSDTPVTHSGQTRNMGGNVGFAYQRNLHSITFMNTNGEHIAADEGIPYGEDLSNETVVNRHREDAADKAPDWSAFVDWYDNQQGTGTPFSFTGTMPDHDIILYAKYVKNAWTVTFDPKSGTLASGQAVSVQAENGTSISNQETTLNQTTRESYELVGWFRQEEETPYNFSDPVTADFTLEAHWRQAGTYYVRYADVNDNGTIEEILQKDPNSYVDQAEVVALGWPSQKTVPEDKNFIGWQIVPSGSEGSSSSASIYRPGEKLVLHAGDTVSVTEGEEVKQYLTLKPVYNTLGTTFIQYNANKGTGTLTDLGNNVTDNIQHDIPIHSDVKLSSGKGFTRAGYELAGWNTNPDADGTDTYSSTRFQPGDIYGVDNADVINEEGNILYAEWKIVIVIHKVDNHNSPLSGAVFRLTTENGQTNASATSGVADSSITIEDDGTAEITGLAKGTYVLTETKAPGGFLALGARAVISVTDEGLSVTGMTLDNQPSSDISFDHTNGFVITVVNYPGTPLPDAGDSGGIHLSLAYLLALAVISLAAGVWMYHQNIRGQRQNE